MAARRARARRLRPCTLAGCLAAWLLAPGCTEPTVEAIGSGPIGGSYVAAATAIARVTNEAGGADAPRYQDVATAGSTANVEGVLAGQLAFGLAQSDVVHAAVNGRGRWMQRGAQSELRAVFALFTEAVTLVATPDSGIRTLGDLAGHRVDIGDPDSGTHRNALEVLETIPPDWRSTITTLAQTADDRSTLYLAGDLDAFFLTVAHPASEILFAVNSAPGARLVPIGRTDAIVAAHPYYTPVSIPVSLYPGIANDADVPTLGVETVLVTLASTPDDVVYALTRAVFADVEALGKFDAVLRGLDPKRMADDTTAPLHPGALRYFREAGLLAGP